MRTKVLQLYKQLLRYGDTLQFTDKKYFKFRVRKGFVDNSEISIYNTRLIKFYIEKGQRVLEQRRVV